MKRTTSATVIFMTASSAAMAQDVDLAQQLSNPIASLISVPFQLNYDSGFGPDDGDRWTLNIQPVIPMSLNSDWNVISRTILPVIHQNDIAGNSGSQDGLGDIVQSFFLSPVEPGPGGLIWGVGPVFLFPTASDELLGGGKWGAGVTGVALKQAGGWTIGGLANHIWSVAGEDDRADISATFVQPFITYTTDDAWTFALNSESTYDWNAEQWSVPVNFQVSKLVQISGRPVSLTGGARYWADGPENGAEDWAARLAVTLLFPR